VYLKDNPGRQKNDIMNREFLCWAHPTRKEEKLIPTLMSAETKKRGYSGEKRIAGSDERTGNCVGVHLSRKNWEGVEARGLMQDHLKGERSTST